jgi:hypothetical protein
MTSSKARLTGYVMGYMTGYTMRHGDQRFFAA